MLQRVEIRANEAKTHVRDGFMMLWMDIDNRSDVGLGIRTDAPMLGHSL